MSDEARLHQRLAGVVPEHDVHQLFIDWAEAQVEDPRLRKLFMRMAERSGIEHRWSVLPPAPGGLPHNEPGGFYHGAIAGHLDADARPMPRRRRSWR